MRIQTWPWHEMTLVTWLVTKSCQVLDGRSSIFSLGPIRLLSNLYHHHPQYLAGVPQGLEVRVLCFSVPN